MTQQSEWNKAIAEFMGCYGDTLYIGGEPAYKYGFKDTHITDRWYEHEFETETPYHTSYDWSYPVYVKIRKYYYSTYVGDKSQKELKRLFGNIQSELLNGNAETFFETLAQFITYYNSINKTTQTNERPPRRPPV